jgi:hypothetical protein
MTEPTTAKPFVDVDQEVIAKSLGDATPAAVRVKTADEIIVQEDARAVAAELSLVQLSAQVLAMAQELHERIARGGR